MPNKQRLRWGVLGVSKINERLLPAFARCKIAQLIGLASRSLDRAREAVARSGIAQAYGSYEALLDDPAIDAVYIPLPNTLHGPWARAAADKGKHILCEKPLTPTAAEAVALVEHCRCKKVQILDGFMWPHHPRTARMRQLLDSGELGAVRRVSAAFTFQLDMKPANIRLKPDMAGGSLLDIGCYPVYAIRWAMGAEPVRVFASARFQYGVDVELDAIFWFADGRMANFDCGFTAPYRGWLEITCEKGIVEIPKMWLPPPRASYLVHRDNREPETVTLDEADQIVLMLDGFSTCVLEGRAISPGPEEAIKSLRVLDALAKSARTGAIAEV